MQQEQAAAYSPLAAPRMCFDEHKVCHCFRRKQLHGEVCCHSRPTAGSCYHQIRHARFALGRFTRISLTHCQRLLAGCGRQNQRAAAGDAVPAHPKHPNIAHQRGHVLMASGQLGDTASSCAPARGGLHCAEQQQDNDRPYAGVTPSQQPQHCCGPCAALSPAPMLTPKQRPDAGEGRVALQSAAPLGPERLRSFFRLDSSRAPRRAAPARSLAQKCSAHALVAAAMHRGCRAQHGGVRNPAVGVRRAATAAAHSCRLCHFTQATHLCAPHDAGWALQLPTVGFATLLLASPPLSRHALLSPSVPCMDEHYNSLAVQAVCARADSSRKLTVQASTKSTIAHARAPV